MDKKAKFLHIRSDERLHEALKASAGRAHRTMQDQARYLLEKALGIDFGEDAAIEHRLLAMESKATYSARGQPAQKKTGNHDG